MNPVFPDTTEQSIFNHSGSVISLKDRTIPFTLHSAEPLIVTLEQVLNAEECNQLIDLSRNRLKRSRISAERTVHDLRTSSGMFFEEGENQLVADIEKRLASIMNVPIEHAEGLQVLSYLPGQEYKAHFDFFASSSKAAENNRISTVILYLNDVEKGGETTFPSLGISVSPKKGNAVYFEYFYQNQLLNEQTLHAGNPVLQGEKWVATQWMRRKKIRL